MSYISGHYRKGHYRNGKWVSGSYVRGHYSGGLGYGSSLSSINITQIDSTCKTNSSDTIERKKLITPKDMKIIREMKKDMDIYSYARTLRFFEAYYPYDVENVHYADVMLSMNICKSIDELQALRVRLKRKLYSGIKQEFLEKMPDEISKELSECVSKDVAWNMSCFKTMKDHLKIDIDTCYNENIVRLLRERETITELFCGECFVNLSFSSNIFEYKDQITQIAKEKSNLDVSTLLETIYKRHEDFKTHWNSYKKFKEGMNGYEAAQKLVADDFTYLRQFNWRLLPWEKTLYSKINRRGVSNSEDYLNERRKYWRQIINKEGKAPRLDIKNREVKSNNDTAKIIIISLVVVGIIVGLFIYIDRSVGGSGDGSIGNWILAIIVILALLKKS